MIKYYKVLGVRNPILEFYDENDKCVYRIQTIGDPHLERRFVNGVSRSMLGKREEDQKNYFTSLLNTPNIDLYVAMGDLFDKMNVSNNIVCWTIDTLKQSALSNPNSKYIILSGNHDISKDKTTTSSFELLSKFFKSNTDPLYSNIFIIDNYLWIKLSTGLELYFDWYDPFQTLDEYVKNNPILSFSSSKEGTFKVAFGHYEVESFNDGSSKYKSELIPEVIKNNFNLCVTGHIHTPGRLKHKDKDFEVIVTGSLQPFSFGESADGFDNVTYVTEYLEECKKNLKRDPDYYEKKCVRVLYQEGDTLDLPDFLCYSKTFKKIPSSSNSAKNLEENLKEVKSFNSFKTEVLSSLEKLRSQDENFISEIENSFISKQYK